MVPPMPLTDGVIGGTVGFLTDAANHMPSNPAIVAALTAATGAVIVWPLWRSLNPDGGALAAAMPRLSAALPAGKALTMHHAARYPLEIPLDEIPRDGAGKSPWDIVGADAVHAAVDQFYSKILNDPELSPYFEDIDLTALKRHQAAFIGQLWGGPVVYDLGTLARVHQPLQISPEKYWRVAGHLMVTLDHLSIPDWIILFTLSRLFQARTLIIHRDFTDGIPSPDPETDPEAGEETPEVPEFDATVVKPRDGGDA